MYYAFLGLLDDSTRNSSQIAFNIAKVQARPVPKIHEKYHMFYSPDVIAIETLYQSMEITRYAPKDVRHVEPCEMSPEHQEIPHRVRDDVRPFRFLPQGG